LQKIKEEQNAIWQEIYGNDEHAIWKAIYGKKSKSSHNVIDMASDHEIDI
jgi:hypothetical protein